MISNLTLVAQSYNLNIKPVTIEYKKIDKISLKLHIYKPEDFNHNKIYKCIIFFSWWWLENRKLQSF